MRRGKQKVKTWEMLERDLLLVFRAMFGEVPKGNKQGEKLAPGPSGFFRRERLEEIIRANSE